MQEIKSRQSSWYLQILDIFAYFGDLVVAEKELLQEGYAVDAIWQLPLEAVVSQIEDFQGAEVRQIGREAGGSDAILLHEELSQTRQTRQLALGQTREFVLVQEERLHAGHLLEDARGKRREIEVGKLEVEGTLQATAV